MSAPRTLVAVAFDSDPADTVDKWEDVTPYVDIAAGITYGRGRKDDHSRTSPQTCSLRLSNQDGRFTPERTDSPHYPNVRIGKRIRVTTRVGTGTGNLLAAEDASFEAGTVGAWETTYFGSPAAVTLANSTTHPSHGSKGLLITYPTASAGAGPQLRVPTVIGRAYTARCVVWVAAGTPAVRWGGIFDGTTVNSTTTGALETLTVTWTATVEVAFLSLRSTSATTSGQQCWVDSVQVDEASSLGTFTTSAPPLSHRYTGYVTEWPPSFPGGAVADTRVTATDRLGWIDAQRKLQTSALEAILAAGPLAAWPLTDPDGSTGAAEISGKSQPPLDVTTFGAGEGLVEFGKGTGPATDSASALMLTPTSTTNGKFLTCQLRNPIGFYGMTLAITFNTSTAAAQTMLRLTDGFGWFLELGVAADGKLTATEFSPFVGTVTSLLSAGSVASGATRTAAVRQAVSAGTITTTLWLDGAQVATTSRGGGFVPTATYATVGGNSSTGNLFTGTLAYAAAYNTGNPDPAAISSAILTGFAGQAVTAAMTQIATWAGINTADLIMDTAELTSMSHRSPAGKSPADVLLDLANDEGGVLFVDGYGRYRFHSRSRRWTSSPVLTLDTTYLGADSVEMTYDTQELANDAKVSRPGGGEGQRVVNEESVTAIGPLQVAREVAAAADSDLLARAGWEAFYRATPRVHVAALPVDLLTMPEADTLAAQALEVGDTITVTRWPDQAASQSLDLTVEGWTERLSLTGWTVTANLSRPVAGQIFILDDPVKGQLDTAELLTVY